MTNANTTQRMAKSLTEVPIFILVGVLVWTAGTGAAQAQAWRFDPIIQAGYEVDDNATLSIRTDEEVRIAGLQGDVSAKIDYLTDTTTFSATPRLRIRQYDESDFDSNDEFLRLNFMHRARSNTFGVRAFYDNENVRTAELADIDPGVDDPDDIPLDDTGRIGIQGDRTRLRMKPYWSYRFTRLTSMRVQLEYTEVSYDDELLIGSSLVDYQDSRANVAINHGFSNLTSGIVELSWRSISNDFGLNEVDTIGGSVGFERDLSEKTSVKAMVGMESVEFLSGGDNEPVVVGELRLVRNLETITLLAQYKRAVASSGNAIPSVRDDLILNFSRQLSEKVSASLGARAYHAEQIAARNDQGRDYLRFGAAFGWNLTQTIKLQLEFRHTIIDRGGVPGERADGNRGMLSFIYRPNAAKLL